MTNITTPPVTLKIDNQLFGGWQNMRISRSLEQMAGSFDLSLAEYGNINFPVSKVKPGLACEILLNNKKVITGYIDDLSMDYHANGRTIKINGRDKTGDLVDCSVNSPTQYKNVTIDKIIKSLISGQDSKKGFGVNLIIAANELGKPFTVFNLQNGETIYAAIDRAARERALLVTSNVNGDLLLTDIGNGTAVGYLSMGGNIKAARADFSHKDRYSEYHITGYDRHDAVGKNDKSAAAMVKDDAITRHRPMTIIDSEMGDDISFETRAEWEKTVRQGRSARGSFTVAGWQQDGIHGTGELWLPNQIVTVNAPMIGLDNVNMLIIGCVYSLDDKSGSQTEIAIANPNSYRLLPGVKTNRVFTGFVNSQGSLKNRPERDRQINSDLDWGKL